MRKTQQFLRGDRKFTGVITHDGGLIKGHSRAASELSTLVMRNKSSPSSEYRTLASRTDAPHHVRNP
ncbi:hypothetical protein C0Q70_07666 [Pomacea canaliculata]|uniref:Uncharacterized protein n=1 Tax=Pomacea canaliculata TaxID=400727 RepID=A0A2T7PFN6_POMCA|nr:hypothetical protein C0Q70_07666 [Pomacea canaliculata]